MRDSTFEPFSRVDRVEADGWLTRARRTCRTRRPDTHPHQGHLTRGLLEVLQAREPPVGTRHERHLDTFTQSQSLRESFFSGVLLSGVKKWTRVRFLRK